MTNWKSWLHGLVAALIMGGTNAVSNMVVDPATFNMTHAGLVALAKACAVGAVLGAVFYLKQSPLPEDSK